MSGKKITKDIVHFLKKEMREKNDQERSGLCDLSRKKIDVLRRIEREFSQYIQERFQKTLAYYFKVFAGDKSYGSIWNVFERLEGVSKEEIYEKMKELVKRVQEDEGVYFIYFDDEFDEKKKERLRGSGRKVIERDFILLTSQIESLEKIIENVVILFYFERKDVKRVESGESVDEETLGQRLFSRVIEKAISKGASDIHVIPKERAYHVFFRVDGFFNEQIDLLMSEEEGEYFLNYVLKRAAQEVKGSQFNPDTRLVYQDARISLSEFLREGMSKIDARIAFIPDGFSLRKMEVVIRLLIARYGREENEFNFYEAGKRKLMSLGYLEEDIDILLEAFLKNRGIIVVSGITNSGKSTLVSNVLSLITHRKVGSIEDPIEYYLRNHNYVQHQLFVSEKEELTMDFERYVKAFKRADYDIIFVGEWRRSEGLTEAIIEQAYAGQLIVTTLHIANSFQIFEALKHMYKVNPEELRSVLLLSWNQVLVPRLCDKCKKEAYDYSVSSEVLRKLNYAVYVTQRMKARIEEFRADVHYVRGDGCKYCDFTGYRGRQVIYDYFVPSVELYEGLKEGLKVAGEIDYGFYKILTTKLVNEKRKSKVDVYLELAKKGVVSMEDICGNEYFAGII